MRAPPGKTELEWLAKDHPETNPITIKPKTVSHMAEQFSWVPLPSCSPPGCPFPIKSLALSAHGSPWTIHFLVLDKSPVSGPGRCPPSCNSHTLLNMKKSVEINSSLAYRPSLVIFWYIYFQTFSALSETHTYTFTFTKMEIYYTYYFRVCFPISYMMAIFH